MHSLTDILSHLQLLHVLQQALSFILIISVIVFIHEFGHYFVARLNNVKIEAFSIGFGKELFGWHDKQGTRWKVSLLPFGGYVKMFGDMNAASAPDSDKLASLSEEERKVAFHCKPLGAKAAIVAAGPVANFLLAMVIFVFFFTVYGRSTNLPIVDEILEGSAAAQAGLQPGDKILSVGGTTVKYFEDLQREIQISPGIPLELRYERNAQEITAKLTPTLRVTKDIFGNEVRVGMLGVRSNHVSFEKLSFPQALLASVRETYNMCSATLKAMGQMVTGRRSLDELGGPLKIAKYSGQSVEKGLNTVLWFIAILSINLGLVNLFPIPVLDGGHLLYYAIEALRGRPMAQKYQEYGFRLGMVLVLTLMVFTLINDLR